MTTFKSSIAIAAALALAGCARHDAPAALPAPVALPALAAAAGAQTFGLWPAVDAAHPGQLDAHGVIVERELVKDGLVKLVIALRPRGVADSVATPNHITVYEDAGLTSSVQVGRYVAVAAKLTGEVVSTE